MIDLEKTVFIVDGQTEVRSFKKKFAAEFNTQLALRVVRCNGKDVSPEGYANAANGILNMALSSYFTKIICVVDREGRRQSADKLATQVKSAIIKKLIDNKVYKHNELNEKINICIPDRMFENWIVSDVVGIKTVNNLIKKDSEQNYYDGKSGATVLKTLMNQPYNKIEHGPKLFNATGFDASKEYSPSFECFAKILEI